MNLSVQKTITDINKTVSVEELYGELSGKVKTSCYEYYDTNFLDYMKIVVDIDIKEVSKKLADSKYDDGDIISKTSATLKEIFSDDININYTTDHRRYILAGQKKKYYKKSYHLVVDNKKINPERLGRVMRKNKNKFAYKIDTSIYREGINKFRLPLTIKEPALEIRTKKSSMKMSLPENLENFKKYCLTLTRGLDEVSIRKCEVEEKEDIDEKKEEDKDWGICELNYEKYNKILKMYKHDKIDKKANTWVCDIDCNVRLEKLIPLINDILP